MKIQIGHYEFDLLFVDPDAMVKAAAEEELGESIEGLCSFGNRRILVLDTLRGSYRASVVLHELLHLVYGRWYLQLRDNEERVVSALADGLTELFVRNPELVTLVTPHNAGK